MLTTERQACPSTLTCLRTYAPGDAPRLKGYDCENVLELDFQTIVCLWPRVFQFELLLIRCIIYLRRSAPCRLLFVEILLVVQALGFYDLGGMAEGTELQ
jgi:hypothetical protein